jgi:hypothetical protein
MLNQKDNDFDDLFRRASDKYPLRTDSADWDRMAAALDNSPPDVPDTGQDTDRRRRRRFLWFFLILPLGGAGYYAFHQAGAGHGPAVATTSAAHSQASTGGNEAGATGTEGVKAGTEGVKEGSGSTAAGSEETGGAGTSDAGTAAGAGGTTSTGDGGTAGARGVGAGTGSVGAVTNGARTGTGGTRKASSGDKVASEDNGAKSGESANAIARSGENSKNKKGNKVYHASDMSEYTVNGKRRRRKENAIGGNDFADAAQVSDKDAALAGNKNKDASRVANYPVNRARISKDYNLTVNVEAPVMKKDSSKTKPKASSKQKSSFLYAGLLAAPDLSTVRFQSTKGMGTTFSLLLGYQFNKRWAIESGVSVDRKRYYTSAEYFKSAPMNPSWSLQNVDGTCYMWEIPVNVRYNFSQNEKTKWFVTAGLSTYLMTRENYNYHYIWWNGGRSGIGDTSKDLRKPSQYWFSIINLSVGYEHRLGRIGNLRIEPYLRVPLSGLGTGKLNIMSTGLNIGITRRLW